jgi:hypothetical protein
MVVPVVAAVAVAVTPASAGASTVSVFQAKIKYVSPIPKPLPCAQTLCGTGTVDGYAGIWEFNLLSFPSGPVAPCSPYTALSTFVTRDGSTLVVDEKGTVCTPGNSGSAPRTGNPFVAPWTDITGGWQVDATSLAAGPNTGVFAGVTGGAGSDSAQITGPEGKVAYTGTLTTG